MKLIQCLFILLLAVSLSACPSDDDPEPSIAEVEGTYRLTFYEFTATNLHEFDGEWIDSKLEEPYKAVDIDMTVTFHSDGTFQPEGRYTLQSATEEIIIERHLWGEYKWKIEGSKLYFSDDSFLGSQISINALTGVIRSYGEEFPIDGLNILGITDTKITLELVVNNTFTWAEIPRQFKRVGTIVLEK
ncbi:MAG: hypothetical protein ACFB15_22735 [Cyclobacteriaceae bacterium]